MRDEDYDNRVKSSVERSLIACGNTDGDRNVWKSRGSDTAPAVVAAAHGTGPPDAGTEGDLP